MSTILNKACNIDAETVSSVPSSETFLKTFSCTDISTDGNNNSSSDDGIDKSEPNWEDDRCELIQRRLSQLKCCSSNDDFDPSQFQKPPSRIPVKSICMAFILCISGFSILTFVGLVLFGKLNDKFADRVWPLIIMGFMMFIPGAYYVRIAYYASKGTPGFQYEDIPEFE